MQCERVAAFGCGSAAQGYNCIVDSYLRQNYWERGAVAFDFESLGIRQLSVRERLLLIEQIWESLPEQVDPGDVPEWHLAELDRRRSLIQADSAQSKPWREVLSSLEETSSSARK